MLYISCPIVKGMRYATVAPNLFSLTVWQYIATYTRRRSREPDRNDVVLEIDDVRNGILLNPMAHHTLGKDIAFLMVRNALILLNRSLMARISRHLTLP